MTTVAGILNEAQTEQAQQRAETIADTAQVGAIKKDEFVFFTAFDGTRNDKGDIALSGNPEDTNVARLYDQVDTLAKAQGNKNIVAAYYAGHGTENAEPLSDWFPPQVTREAISTAEEAYKAFCLAARDWLKDHPGGEVTTAITSFSRGTGPAAIFSQMLYEKGLIDPKTGQALIEPGKVGVSAGVIFDPVTNGTKGNMAFAPNVKNVVIIRADSEFRGEFLADNHQTRQGITVLTATGNHCNIGGGYGDDGLGNLHLDAATRFLQKSGLEISEVDPSRKLKEHQVYKVHDESGKRDRTQVEALLNQPERGKWSVTDTYKPEALTQASRRLEKTVQPAQVIETPQGEQLKFQLYNGKPILREHIEKARAFMEDAAEKVVLKYSQLSGVLEWRMEAQKETAFLSDAGQQLVMQRIDERMVESILAGNFLPPPQVTAAHTNAPEMQHAAPRLS
jgi:hypothetical protein